MALATQTTNSSEAQLFRRLILTNSRYWLTLAQANVDQVMGETPQVLKALEYALSLLEAWPAARELLRRLSPLMIRQGHGLIWEGFLRRGIARSAEEQDPAEIELRLELGNFYRLQGRLAEARECLQAAVGLCERDEQWTHYWTLKNHLGLVARLSGQHEEALAYSQQVLAEPNLSPAERAEALNVMGLVAFDRRAWQEALDYFEQALALYHAVNDSYEMARILNNRGITFLHSKRLDEAQKSYEESILQFRATGDQAESFKVVMNLGNVFLMKQKYEAAIRQYQEALPVFHRYNYSIDLAHIYNNLGMAYAGLSEWKIAETYFLASIELWKGLKDQPRLANVLDNLGDMFIRAGHLKQAYDVLNRALQILRMDPDNAAYIRLRQVIENRLHQLEVKID